MNIIKRILRCIILAIGIPVCVVFPLTAAFILLFLMMPVVIGLLKFFAWVSNNPYPDNPEGAWEDLKEWGEMSLYPFQWAWNG